MIVNEKQMKYISLLYYTIFFIFLGCGSTKYAQISSENLIPLIEFNSDIKEVEREILTIRAVLLAEQERKLLKNKKEFKKLTKYQRQVIKERVKIAKRLLKEKRREVKANVNRISEILRNFALLESGMTLDQMRKFGFDMSSHNVAKFPGTKALSLWYTEQSIIPSPPHFFGETKVDEKTVSLLNGYRWEEKYIPSPNSGSFRAFVNNRRIEVVLGFHYQFEAWTRVIDGKEILITVRKGGPRAIFQSKEEYETKKSKILKIFKSPLKIMPGI